MEACPDLLTDNFTLDSALDIFDGANEEAEEGLSLKQFLTALSDIAEERYPDVGAWSLLYIDGGGIMLC